MNTLHINFRKNVFTLMENKWHAIGSGASSWPLMSIVRSVSRWGWLDQSICWSVCHYYFLKEREITFSCSFQSFFYSSKKSYSSNPCDSNYWKVYLLFYEDIEEDPVKVNIYRWNGSRMHFKLRLMRKEYILSFFFCIFIFYLNRNEQTNCEDNLYITIGYNN